MPFGAIPIAGISRWTVRRQSTHSWQRTIDLSNVSNGFGILSLDDPDPFGVLALEQAGLEIKEAGTHSRPSSDAFEFKPSLNSPVFRRSIQSIDGISQKESRRNSKRSTSSVDHGTQTVSQPLPMIDRYTAVELFPTNNEGDPTILDSSISLDADSTSLDDGLQNKSANVDESKLTPLGGFPFDGHEVEPASDTDGLEPQNPAAFPPSESPELWREELGQVCPQIDSACDEGLYLQGQYDDQFDENEAIIEEAEPAVQVIGQAFTSTATRRAKIVLIPPRAAPALPARNPRRRVTPRLISAGEVPSENSNIGYLDDSSDTCSPSPTASAFDRRDSHSTKTPEQTSLPNMDSLFRRYDGASQDDALVFRARKAALANVSVVKRS